MIDKYIFFIWVFWYLHTYGPPHILLNFFIRFYRFYDEYFTLYNMLIYPGYWEEEEEEEEETIEDPPKEPPKYENKYFDDIRKINKEWVFTEDENNEMFHLIDKFYNSYVNEQLDRIKEITSQIRELEKDISQDTDVVNFIENINEDGSITMIENTLEERNDLRGLEINGFQEEIDIIKNELNTEKGMNKIKVYSEEQSRQYIINKKLDKLANCYVMEKTPVGNVIMIYQKERESFKYYSDSNVPYRYLEVVGRKYIKVFNCRPIFVDMEEELSLFEEKWEKENEIKKNKEDKIKDEEAAKTSKPVEVKKNVFAKFKSYNKEAGNKISMAAPPKNSIPNKSVSETKENEKIILKERANRYTYEGKLANFNFLQKIERKVFNKKLGLSFADFKKMQS